MIKHKNINEAFLDVYCIVTMQEELHLFERNKVWHLQPRLKEKTIIETMWAFKIKLDDQGTITRNKPRLVLQGYNQEES